MGQRHRWFIALLSEVWKKYMWNINLYCLHIFSELTCMYRCRWTYRTLEELVWALKWRKIVCPPAALSLQHSPLPTPSPASLCSASLSMFFKYSRKHNLFIHFYVYLPNLFPYLPASTSFTAMCHCLYFLKLLVLTHSSALPVYLPGLNQQSATKSFPLAHCVDSWERTSRPRQCLRSQHLLQVTFWSSPFCRGMQVTLKQGLQSFMLFRWATQAVFL